ncbi:sensor histidine kinase [Halorientalis pallida]|uniref:histidine kinase n=1 Tax=Halorientalis pallida TaxID=2479928 RepID=A0A498L718_9EURY|nr:histidine kinase N-terminal 7TM domain-containing protein [Halorientalis pallida]RXK50505.1 two-component system sensor histidine kinase [Halorientalis pallida]
MAASTGSLFTLVFISVPLLAVLLTIGISVWIYRNHRGQRGAKWFVASLLGLAGYALFTSLQMLGGDRAVMTTFFHIASTSAVGAFVAFGAFTSAYSRSDFHRHPVGVTLAVAALGSHLVLLVTNPIHGLYYADVLVYTDPAPYVAAQEGPGSLLMVVPIAMFVWYGEVVLVKRLLSTPGRGGRQMLLVLAGILSIGVMQIVGETGLLPAPGFLYVVWGIIPFAICNTVALFRFDLLDVQPIARSAVVENLRDPVIVLDEQRRVVDFNDASVRLWPDLGEQVGRPFEAACPRLAETVDLSGADAATPDKISFAVDGQERHYSVNTSRVGGDGDGSDWLSMLLRDVTALEQSRWQLETQNERLDQVGSTISHDLRNPINVADGYTELLQDIAEEEIPDPDAAEKAIQYTDEIQNTHDRMVDIISDVLTIAREGKTVEETDPVALDDVAREAWSNVDTDSATLAVADTRTFQADRSKLLTILENLFRNSIEHGSTGNRNSEKSGDSVEHGPAGVTVAVGSTADGFYVEDDGPGIPDEHVESLFEYGYTTTDDGTGLGLSIVETMAESHGWTVELDESAPGARFVFGNVSTDAVTDSAVGTAQLS